MEIEIPRQYHEYDNETKVLTCVMQTSDAMIKVEELPVTCPLCYKVI